MRILSRFLFITNDEVEIEPARIEDFGFDPIAVFYTSLKGQKSQHRIPVRYLTEEGKTLLGLKEAA